MGERIIRASTPDGQSAWQAQLLLSPNQTTHWTVSSRHGAVTIVNERQETIEIHHRKQTLASVRPGRSVLLDRIPTGSQTLTAFGTTSHSSENRVFAIDAQRGQRWVLETTPTQLHVSNKMPEEITVYVDRQLYGSLPAKGEVIFTQIAAGKRVLEAIGAASGKRIMHTHTIEANKTSVWDVQTEIGHVLVTNQTDEPLLTPPAMRHQLEHIRVGQQVRLTIPTGPRRLHLIGRQSGESYGERFLIVPKKNAVWNVQTRTGQLHVFNHTKETQDLRVDGTPTGSVAPGKRSTFILRTGPHKLVATAQKSGQAIANTATIFHGHASSWSLRPAQATLRVVNTTGEVLDLRLNGDTLGHIEIDGERTYGPFPPGPHRVDALGRWSGGSHSTRLTLKSGRTDTWEVTPQHGSVHIQNDRQEAIRVQIAGQETRVIPPQQTMTVSLPQGRHLLELIGNKTRAFFVRPIALRPNRTIVVVAPKGPASVRVENTLPVALTVHANQSLLGTVPAHSSVTLPVRSFGWVTLEAVGPDDTLRWNRRIHIQEDREMDWRINP